MTKPAVDLSKGEVYVIVVHEPDDSAELAIVHSEEMPAGTERVRALTRRAQMTQEHAGKRVVLWAVSRARLSRRLLG